LRRAAIGGELFFIFLQLNLIKLKASRGARRKRLQTTPIGGEFIIPALPVEHACGE
jgi:hypothetical protein